MDPKVWSKLVTHHRRGYGIDVEALHDRFPLRHSAGKGPKMGSHGYRRLRRWKVVSWLPWMFSGYKSIYIGERSRSLELRGAHEGGGRLPTSWPPRCFLNLQFKSPGLCLFQKRSLRRFRSVWVPFDIPFLRNTEIGKKTTICTGRLVSRLVPKII